MITTTTNDRNETIWINESGREFVMVAAFDYEHEYVNGVPTAKSIESGIEWGNTIEELLFDYESKGIKILQRCDTGWYCQYNMIDWEVNGQKRIFVARETVAKLKHYWDMEADKTSVLPYATIEDLEFGEGDRAEMFRKFWWYNIPNQPHHATDKWVWKVRDQAGDCVKARDYHKLFKVCRAASLKASCDEAVDAIAHIWDAMATCLYFMGVDTNHPYNLAEDA